MMMTDQEQQKIMYRLRCAAERDPNDIIANACSQLAFELETPKRHLRLTDQDLELIQYATRKAYAPLKKEVDLEDFFV